MGPCDSWALISINLAKVTVLLRMTAGRGSGALLAASKEFVPVFERRLFCGLNRRQPKPGGRG